MQNDRINHPLSKSFSKGKCGVASQRLQKKMNYTENKSSNN